MGASRWLQWGHERALVEILRSQPPRQLRFRFNGATSARSWKSGQRPGGRSGRGASMGPRARARGNVNALIQGEIGYVASMGPRARARGNGSASGGGASIGLASMGPRARARGNVPIYFVWQRQDGASMGPRARARGNLLDESAVWPRYWLQWGHERALVEMNRKSWSRRGNALLQWGHERALVEISLPRGCRQSQHGFNGATSARSWKWTRLLLP